MLVYLLSKYKASQKAWLLTNHLLLYYKQIQQTSNFHLITYLETLVQPHLYSFSLIMIGNLPWRRSCCPLKEFEALLPMVMSNRNRIENKTNIENKLLHFLSFENPLPKFHFNPLTPNRGKIFNLHIWYFKINNRFHSVFNDG